MALSKTQIGRALCCAALLLVRAGWAGAQPAPSAHVDLELILAVDASGSVDQALREIDPLKRPRYVAQA